MKRRSCFVLAALLLVSMLGGCQWLCRHDWEAANCEAPKTCVKCDLTEGETLGHQWQDATCEAPRTCSRCGDTRGEPKGHRWADATCVTPMTCSVCAKTRGAPAGHDWLDATCQKPKTCTVCAATEGTPLYHQWQEATTEAPKTCTHCGRTIGFAIDADARFTTAETAALQGTWMTDFAVSGSMVGEADFTHELMGTAYITFGNAGTLSVQLELQDLAAFENALLGYIKQRIYDEFTAKGLGESAADLAIKAATGMSVDEYAAQMLAEINVPGIIAELTKTRVYYAKADTVYVADDWNRDFQSSTYRFENGKLLFAQLYLEDAAEPLRWTKVEE